MKISVITWDASFRESFHTVTNFLDQDFPKDQFEFIWVEFYENTNEYLNKYLSQCENFQLVNLGHNPNEHWHLGKCLNAGGRQAKGDILVLVDGDIIVDRNHLNVIEKELALRDDLILYFRRWDEPSEYHGDDSYTIGHLEEYAILTNATNYAGCVALHKKNWEFVNGYEENDVFAGPGASSLEMYLRLRNAGFAIKWHDKKIFHPWHESSGSSDKLTIELQEIAKEIPWLRPYCGISQSWVLRARELDLTFKANDGTMAKYRNGIPTLNQLRRTVSRGQNKGVSSTSYVKKLVQFLVRRIRAIAS